MEENIVIGKFIYCKMHLEWKIDVIYCLMTSRLGSGEIVQSKFCVNISAPSTYW